MIQFIINSTKYEGVSDMKNSNDIKTEDFYNIVKDMSDDEIAEFLDKHSSAVSFTVRLYQHLGDRPQSYVYDQPIGISKSQCNYIFNGERKPSRNNVIKIAFALGLNLEETNELLKLAGERHLSPNPPHHEGWLVFALNRGMNISDTEALLKNHNCEFSFADKDDKYARKTKRDEKRKSRKK